ncbi:MAG: HEAT repeat domain-containing protein [Oscillospiraceae bacterium]|nr:HEAT repeat domain-containing protein [Ruminococcus sp.]MBR0485233.1 HEAT repeat domain-containing protein [Oscillospiraceae bacterium]
MDKFEKLISLEEKPISPEDVSLIYECLTDEDALLRSEAVSLLSRPELKDTEKDLQILLSMCNDADALVRTEVYDVLSAFIDKRIPERLQKAILHEPDELARSYAIMSWADSVRRFTSDFSKPIAFIQKYQKMETSESCLFAYAYAQYQFHNAGSLKKMLSFLNSKDYRIRCSVVNSFRFANERDLPAICQAFRNCYESEETRAVRSVIESFFRFHNQYVL